MKLELTIFFVLASAVTFFSRECYCLPKNNATVLQDEDPAVTRLREYLRFQSVHPDPDEGYEQIVTWLEEQAKEIGFEYELVDFEEPNRFVVLMTWKGSNPALPSILLNSHVDVVTAEPEKWRHPPFDALKDENGNIYARGAVDMKSATVAELEAIRKLKSSGFQPLRTIHLTMMPDEEVGGDRGIVPFLATDLFKSLNVGIDIDEGFPTGEANLVHITYAEKTYWLFKIIARGESSHASNLPEYTAAQRLQIAINKITKFRQAEYERMVVEHLSLDQVTALNLVRLGGGTADNIIPNELWATFNMRILLRPGLSFEDIEEMLGEAAAEASLGFGPGSQVTVEYLAKYNDTKQTVANESSVWWTAVQTACQEMSISCEPKVFNAITDGRFVRNIDIPVLGICPFPNTPNTAHQVDEYINEDDFLEGIDRYVTIIRQVAMVPSEDDDGLKPDNTDSDSGVPSLMVVASSLVYFLFRV